jgi:hypothetical protein
MFRAFRTCLSQLLLDMNDKSDNSLEQHMNNRAINVAFFLNNWTT